ncbi:hypothetical protein VUR80DRAFT_7219 [Thermomyces stellatus]
MAPSACDALVVCQNGDAAPQLIRRSIPVPTPGDHQLLVRVTHAAQNPTDVQSFDSNMFGDGAVLGCDFVGTVEATGPAVKRIAVGATVAGLIWGGEVKGLGAYSQYALADERICFPVPQGTTPEQASTIPLAAATAWLALFSKDCLHIERGSKQAVLIWGGSSSVGNYAIQLGALEGLEVITTCSPRHAEFVRSLGAKHVFDYRDEKVLDKIKEVAPDLKYVFDTIGGSDTSATASRAINPSGGSLCTVRPGKANTEGVTEQTTVTDVFVWTAFLKEHRYKKFYWPPHKEDHELSAELFEKLFGLLREGRVVPNRVKVFNGGLGDVEKGFQEHRDGRISGYKIVYRVQ